MKKLLFVLSLCIGFFFFGDAHAQMVYKLGSGTSGSSFLFGSTSAKKTQLLYLPGDFNAALSGSINKIYFMYNTTYSPTYTNLVISLGETTMTGFDGTNFFTGLTEVLNEASYTIPAGTPGEWFSIALTTNFTFDETKTIIVEVKWDDNTATSFSTRYGSSQSGKKLYSSDNTSATGSSSSTWQNFGYDVQQTDNMSANGIVSPAGLVNTPSAEVKVVFENNGINAMSGKYYAAIYGPAKAMLYIDSANFSNVPSGQVDTISFTDFNGFVGNGTYTVKGIVSAVGDAFNGDDTTSSSFNRFTASWPMIVSWTSQYSNGEKNRDSAFAALTALGVDYDQYDRYTTPIYDFQDWSTIMWLEDGSIQTEERNALIGFANAGAANDQKSIIIFGDDIGYFHGRETSSSYDSLFYKYTLHAMYYADDPQSADQTRICGASVNPGLCDSLDSSYPDAVGAVMGGTPAYRYDDLPASSDSVAGVVYDGDTYNTCYFAFEIREVVTPIAKDASQVVNGALQWVINAGGVVPVELTALSASVNGTSVTLNWTTSTETNNQGFAIERKVKSGNFSEIGFVNGYGTTTETKTYSYTDSKLAEGDYIYRLKQVDFDGAYEYSAEIEVVVTIPKVFSLEQNYPNPFNPTTKIRFAIPFTQQTELWVCDILGQKVKTVIDGVLDAGKHEVTLDAKDLASGVYFYRLKSGDFVKTMKMMILK